MYFSGELARKMMVRWCGLEWRPAGECGSECVCVCFSKEKRNKMKETKERAGQKREERWVKMCVGECD